MVDAKILERFVSLVDAGESVLVTQRRPSPGVISANSVDLAMFQQWRTSVMSLLSATFTQNGFQFQEFQERCKVNWHSDLVQGLAILKAAKDDLEQDIDSAPPERISIEDLPLHPRIASVCVELYQDEHYANAVLDASKALVNFVKEKSGKHDLDGAGLMTEVFSRNHPILAFNDLSDRSDLDEQEGMMHLYAGVALGIRNPRGHEFPEDSPERALDYIVLISLLAKRLEETQKKPAT